MDILQTAINAEGGVSFLAKSLGLSCSRVCNWLVRGVPEGWSVVLKDRYASPCTSECKRQLPGQAVVSRAESGCE